MGARRVILLLTAVLCGACFLALDQAGRRVFEAPVRGGREGASRLHVAAPPGRYAIQVKLRLESPLDRVAVTAAGRTFARRGLRATDPRQVLSAHLGFVDVGPSGLDAIVETSSGRRPLMGVALEPGRLLSLDAWQRLSGALAVAAGIALLFPLARRSLLVVPAILLLLPVARAACFGVVRYAPGDMRFAFYPWHELSRREWAAGRVALWNPHAYLGLPHLANMQTQIAYPPVTAILALGASFETREQIVWILNLVLAGTGAAVLARRYGASRAGSATAALLFLTSPPLVNPDAPCMVSATALLPWVLVAAVSRRGLALAAMLALAFLSGHLQTLSYIVTALAIVIALPPGRGRMGASRIALACVLAAFLAAILGLPFLEYAVASTRGAGVAPQHLTRGALSPAAIAEMLDLRWGDRGVAVMPSARVATSILTGSLSLPLVCLGSGRLLRRGRRTRTLSLLSLSAAGIALALGDFGPFSPLALLAKLPLFAAQRGPMRALRLTVLAFAILAGLGVDRLRAAARLGRGGRPLAIGLVMVALAGAIVTLAGAADREVVAGALVHLLLLGASAFAVRTPRWARRGVGLAVLVFLAAERFDDFWTLVPGGLPSDYASLAGIPGPVRREMREVDIVLGKTNDGLVNGRLSAWGYDPVIPKRTGLLWDRLDPALFVFDAKGRLGSIGSRLQLPALVTPSGVETLERMGVDRIVVPQRVAGGAATMMAEGRLVPRKSVRGVEILGLPRARRATAREGADEIGAAVRDTLPGEVRVVLDRAPQSAGKLVLADAFFPGWVARAGGEVRPIRAADGALREVDLRSGDREVVFRYEPFSYRLGLFLTSLGLAAAAGLAVRAHARF